ncbi:single-stranded DNA-binding protein [Nonomuraea cavernae]|uniref:single-stranded DNA-binding protein n=1 Tax=Nonomuraea cavernae TaxID=2045107 RepID=UPI0033EC83C1
MNDIYITLTGNVAAEPRQHTFEDGARVTSLRVLTAHRYFDKKTGQWTDGEKVCFAVRCWRTLGENVAQSVKVGQPVVVSGKLRIREFGPEGDRRFMPEVEASAVGHDLRWGMGSFTKPDRGGAAALVSREMRERLDEETQDWAMGAGAAERPSRDRDRAEPLPLTAGSRQDAPLRAMGSANATNGDTTNGDTGNGITGNGITGNGDTRNGISGNGDATNGGTGNGRTLDDDETVRILGAGGNECEAEDAEWPTEERAAA